MSATDFFGESYDQVKCWNNDGTHYSIGDECPSIQGQKSYFVVMREGYTICVENCQITHVDNTDRFHYTSNSFDKWGDYFTVHTVGIMNEPYFWNEE